MADRDDQLTREEEDVAAAVADALAATAEEFADAVEDATEFVAARFSVGRIARMWGSRVNGLVKRLLGTAETAAEAAADDLGTELPDGWDDLPGRYDDDRPLPDGIGQYVETTEHLLRAVGDRLAEAARRELAAGLDAGEDVDQLRARLLAAFSREGAQLGPGREHRVAQTEATRAWNTATLAAARAIEGPDRPVVKQWLTRRDTKVRDAHDQVDGQLRLLDEPFTVAGVPMDAPGDPTAPPALVCNCRCRLAVQAPPDRSASAYEPKALPRGHALDSEESSVETEDHVTAAGGYTGAMIALIPTAEDAARLALAEPGAESAAQLHATLYYLGEGADWSTEERNALVDAVRHEVEAGDLSAGPVYGRAFGANQWNADTDNACWVWAVGDDPDRPRGMPTLDAARWTATYALEGGTGPDIPRQHSPWQPHVCAAYSASPALLAEMNARLGGIRFDRIRVAFAGEYHDIPLGTQPPEPEAEMAVEDAPRLELPTWSTPGETALAYEDTETGDGRVFRPGALYWEGAGPWPLQHADEMLSGHQGAELAGAIQTLARDGARIVGTGVLYPQRPAGADALMLLKEGAPLGVSVDLDDVSVEFVDRTIREGEEEDGPVLLFASLPHASFMRLTDGSWSITTSATAVSPPSGQCMTITASTAHLITGPDGLVTDEAVRRALFSTGTLTAAAGDRDSDDGVVVHRESSGDLLMRVTKARLRGATLVAMPAYDQARIVLDGMEPTPVRDGVEPSPDRDDRDEDEFGLAADGSPSAAQQRVEDFVRTSPVAIGAREVAQALGIPMAAARRHLARAAKAGRLVRLARGLYVGPTEEGTGGEDVTAAAVEGMTDLEASAWTAMQDLPPMPADWFREPTAEELPPGSGGVHTAGGRIWGWVARMGEPHAGMPGRVTLESLGRIDLSHFLRARFALDDGTLIRAGAMTMNVGHHRDGAECETASCQFDDTRTVAGIVTVGINAGGMWFAGAAGPWLSEWDRTVFKGCQPSYHMKKGADGAWQLRGVLTVPMPGHSSPLLAAAVCDRSNLALAASAGTLSMLSDILPDTGPDTSGHGPDTDTDASGHDPAPETVTASDQGGHRPDTDTAVSGHPPLPGGDVDAIAAALLASVPLLDALAAALEQRTNARAEVDRLALAVGAPADHTTTTEGTA